ATGGSRVGRAGGARGSICSGRSNVPAVLHHDDEGLRFTLGDQVIHDQAGESLPAPAGFIFARAVLQIEHRVTLARVLVVIRRRVNETVAVCVAGLREVVNFAELSMWHVLERVEVRILRGHLDSTAPASGA